MKLFNLDYLNIPNQLKYLGIIVNEGNGAPDLKRQN